jgi:hypothetical protein
VVQIGDLVCCDSQAVVLEGSRAVCWQFWPSCMDGRAGETRNQQTGAHGVAITDHKFWVSGRPGSGRFRASRSDSPVDFF